MSVELKCPGGNKYTAEIVERTDGYDAKATSPDGKEWERYARGDESNATKKIEAAHMAWCTERGCHITGCKRNTASKAQTV